MTTMQERHGGPVDDHECCDDCGFCKTCKDCGCVKPTTLTDVMDVILAERDAPSGANVSIAIEAYADGRVAADRERCVALLWKQMDRFNDLIEEINYPGSDAAIRADALLPIRARGET